MGEEIGRRFPALLALALPVFAGLAYLHLAGAPQHYLLINAGALVVALALTATLRAPASERNRKFLTLALVAMLFVPLMTGPSLNGVARWLPLGPVQLHTGSLVVPAIIALTARDRDTAAPVFLVCILAGLLQPDAALGFAIVFALVGLHDATRDWRMGLVCILGFFASLAMAYRGNPPPVEFVERVIVDAAGLSLFAALGLFATLLASFLLILFAIPSSKAVRYGVGGSLFGFTMMSIMAHYPSVLIGYGAAPILGLGLALGLATSGKAEIKLAQESPQHGPKSPK